MYNLSEFKSLSPSSKQAFIYSILYRYRLNILKIKNKMTMTMRSEKWEKNGKWINSDSFSFFCFNSFLFVIFFLLLILYSNDMQFCWILILYWVWLSVLLNRWLNVELNYNFIPYTHNLISHVDSFNDRWHIK
jgi:hypothetical protein